MSMGMSLNIDERGRVYSKEGARVLEMGGGANPLFRPNIDVRPCLDAKGDGLVDIVVDFEKPFTREHDQALRSEEWDGVFSRYALEHVGWRNIPQLLGEIHRILKPGGDLLLILPNTHAQMEHLLRTEDWDDAGSMLFGGQDYGENAHKSFWSPSHATRLLTQAGFSHITVTITGEKKTDMVVQAVRAHSYARKVTLSGGEDLTTAPEITVIDRPGLEPKAFEELRILNENGRRVVPAGPHMTREQMYELVRRETGFPVPERICVPRPACETYPHGHYEVMLPPGFEGQDTEQAPVPPVQPVQPVVLDERTKEALRAYRASLFDRAYFDGGNSFGGYQSYRDFPCHETTARAVLARRPENVLELGCARGYVIKRLHDSGVPAAGWDVSRHAVLTRAAHSVNHADALDPECWTNLAERQVDLCFSIGFLDRVPEALLDDLIGCLRKYTRRGLHGIDAGLDNSGDKTRCTFKPLDWWRSKLPEGHEVVNKDELEGPPPESYLRGDGKIKLQLGSYTNMFHQGWINVDVVDLRDYAAQQGYLFLHHDLRGGLPFATESVDLICSHHCLEHLTYDEGFELLRECRRVLKPGGRMRLSVPDTEGLLHLYLAGERAGGPTWEEVCEISATAAGAACKARKTWEVLLQGHASMYDEEALADALRRALMLPEAGSFRQGWDAQLMRETVEGLAPVSLFMNAAPAG